MWKAKLDAVEAGLDRLEEEKINQFRIRFRAMINEGLLKFPKPTKKKYALGLGRAPEGKTRSLLLRLQERENEAFRFLEDFDVPFSNNESLCAVLENARVFRRPLPCNELEARVA